MAKLKQNNYLELIKEIQYKSLVKGFKRDAEFYEKELKLLYNQYIHDNPNFIDDMQNAISKLFKFEHLNTWDKDEIQRGFELFYRYQTNKENHESNEPFIKNETLKLKWNGSSIQLYSLLKQLSKMRVKVKGKEVPYLDNTLEELGEFIANYVDGGGRKAINIKNELSRSNKPLKGKRLVVKVE